MLLNIKAEGDIVECGCFKGGSAAKISIIAKLLGKKLFVFDSFKGLPPVDKYNSHECHCRRNCKGEWPVGEYTGNIEEVKNNIRNYGEISVCSFVKGWFRDTIKKNRIPEKICFVFADVDIASSAKDCLIGLWNNITKNGVYVSHDFAFIKVLFALHDRKIWSNLFNSYPPIFFGGGFGLYDSSPHIGFFLKGDSLDPDYIKSLMIDK